MTMTLKERVKRLLQGLPSRVKIGRQYVGPGEPSYVIAEIGINHNGDVELAKKLIDAAADAGVQAVKFQKRTTTEILTKEGLARPYLSPHAFAPTYGAHREKLEFTEAQYRELKKYAEIKNVRFFASIWDHTSADCMDRLGVDAYKIPSADLTNTPLLEYVAQKNKPVLISTGMSTMEEIEEAVRAVLKHNDRLIIFHCLSLYPSPEDKINLSFMDVLKEKFAPLPIGYSGHEMSLLPTIAAVARGACIIERHLTLDKKMKGSDHAASLEPHEFKELVASIRQIEKINGVPEKILYEELQPLREKLAKSLVARTRIPRGSVIRAEFLTAKGPGSGIKPSLMGEVIGRIAQLDIEEDTHLPREVLNWPTR